MVRLACCSCLSSWFGRSSSLVALSRSRSVSFLVELKAFAGKDACSRRVDPFGGIGQQATRELKFPQQLHRLRTSNPFSRICPMRASSSIVASNTVTAILAQVPPWASVDAPELRLGANLAAPDRQVIAVLGDGRLHVCQSGCCASRSSAARAAGAVHHHEQCAAPCAFHGGAIPIGRAISRTNFLSPGSRSCRPVRGPLQSRRWFW